MDLLDKQLQANLRGDFEEGWRIAQILEKERPHCNRCAFNRGWHLLQQGKFQEGFTLLDRGRWERVFGSPPLQTNRPIFNTGDDINGKHIVIRAEGGLGDEIINIRFVKDLAEQGATVIVGANQTLMSVFKRVDGVSSMVVSGYEQAVYHDYWIPSMSLPRLSGHTYETLSSKSYLTSRGSMDLPGDYKVGICWSGNPEFEHEQHRRFPPEKLIDIYKIPGIKVYSFQRDTNLRELPEEVYDLKNFLLGWEETLQFLDSMDLVISSCTSVAHAAAALGKETWVITPILPYYIWALPGNKSPWYDAVTLYRQIRYSGWEETFENLYFDLKERIGG
jgi:hypothetical protein